MTVVRARALDEAGREGEALEELVKLNLQSPKADYLRNIVQRYYQLGRTDEAIRHARQLGMIKDATPHDLLMVAQVTLKSDPDFARQISEKYVEQGNIDIRAVPYLLEIQRSVGDFRDELQDMFAASAREFFASDDVMRFESVEEALEKIDLMSEDKRQRRRRWEHGGAISHLAFADDVQTYLGLLMANADGVVSQIGDLHKPLLFTAGLERPKIDIDVPLSKTLALDISALLLAWRFKILEPLEKAFKLQIPSKAPRLLVEALEAWRFPISVEDCRKYRDFERRRTIPLQYVDDDEDSGVKLRRFYPHGELPDELGSILRDIQECGALHSDQFCQLLADLDIAPDFLIETDIPLPASINMDGSLVFSFIRNGALDAVCERTTVSVSWTDMNKLASVVEEGERLHALRSEIEMLQAHVSAKILNKTWGYLPSSGNCDVEDNESNEITNSNPLIGSLHQTFSRAEHGSKPLVWIEDRFLQRHNLANVLSLADILSALRSASILSSSATLNIEHNRRTAGLGFTPLDHDHIISALQRATVRDETLVETQELKELRITFALQVRLLSYIDWNETRQAADGRILGELRHAKNLGFLLPHILKEIWFEGKLELSKVVAASEWLWKNIRIESIRPPEESVDSGKLNVMSSILLLDCIIQPFFHSLQKLNSKDKDYQSFIDWLFVRHLSGRLELDRTLRDAIVDNIVNLFSVQSKREIGGNKKEQELAERLLAREINNLIELLPTDIQNEIYSRPGFAQRIFIKRDFEMNTPFGSFNAGGIERAIASALKGRTRAVTLKGLNGEQAGLEVEELPGGERRFKIASGDQRFILSDYVVMLTMPEASQRLVSFEVFAKQKFRDEKYLADARSILGSNDDIYSRIKRWNALRALDFSETLENLAGEFTENGGGLSASYFDLPDAEALLRYTGLPANGENADMSIKAASEFVSCEGSANPFARRLVACQVLLGRTMVEPPDDIQSWEDRTFFERTLCHSLQSATVLSTPDFLVDERDRFDDFIELFSLIVRKGAQSALLRDDYRALPEWKSALLVWTWAVSLADVLCFQDIDLKKFTSALEDGTDKALGGALHGNGTSLASNTAGIGFSGDWCRQRIFGILTEKVDVTTPIKDKALLTLIGHYRQDGWFPNPNIMFDRRQNDWLDSERSDCQSWLRRGLIAPSETLTKMGSVELPDVLIRDFDAAPAISLLNLFLLATPGSLHPSALQSVVSRAGALLRVPNNRDLDDQEQILLRNYGQMTGELGDEDGFTKICSVLVHNRYGVLRPPAIPEMHRKTGDTNLFDILADAAFTHARTRDVALTEKIEILGRLLQHLFDLWPAANRTLHHVLLHFIDMLPVAMARPLWFLINRIRCGEGT
jgi:hypothetical protein